MVEVKIKRLPHSEGIDIPAYQSKGAVGFDLRAAEEVTIGPINGTTVNTGFAVELPEGFELQIRSRSGMAKKGVVVANSPGTIDSDYRGEIKILIHNASQRPVNIQKGERIAQGVVMRVPRAEFVEVDELSETERGAGGFGSTGTN